MDLAVKFQDTHPHAFFLNADDPEPLHDYLAYQGWIDEDTGIESITPAGDGNMNKVLRLQLSDGRSVILKQSRPWVERFPDIPAPAERANIEGAFYHETSDNETISELSPELLHHDPDSHILMLEDLGQGSDMTYLYDKGETLEEETLHRLMEYLAELHHTYNQHACDFYIENRPMRKLNAEHMFRFPFVEDNGLDLDEITPGLEEIAAQYRNDKPLMEQIAFLQYRYLQNGEVLLQGDFFPGSFIDTGQAVHVIDPEFCFFGDPEFDLGVFYAHMLMAQQPEEITDSILDHYEQPMQFSDMLYEQYTGVEIIRRILGLAQLPLSLNLEEKKALLEKAYAMLMDE